MQKATMMISLYIDHEMYGLISSLALIEKRSRTNLVACLLDERRDEIKVKIEGARGKNNV